MTIDIYQCTPDGFNAEPTEDQVLGAKVDYKLDLALLNRTLSKHTSNSERDQMYRRIAIEVCSASMAKHNAKGALRRIDHCDVYEVSFTIDRQYRSVLVALEPKGDKTRLDARVASVVHRLVAPAKPLLRISGPHDFTQQPHTLHYL